MTKIYCAIDTPDVARATELARQVSEAGCGVKLGLEFFASNGPAGIAAVSKACPDAQIFMDVKFHDIPNTVAGALRGAARLGVAYVNVHASGGADMMRAGQDALVDESARLGLPTPKLLAVTVFIQTMQVCLWQIMIRQKMNLFMLLTAMV